MGDRRSERNNDPTRTAIEGPPLTPTRAATRTSAEAFIRAAIAEGSVLAGRYQVERPLGQGGMGAVYRVRDTIHPDRPTALKILGAGRPDREALRRFRAEFGLLAQLTHPNLTPVYDFDTQDETGLCFFTMEHVDGVDLESAIGGAGWRDVLEPIVAVCRALAFIHSRRIIHFDVKPSNIMVTPDGTVKVLDFGIAELVQAVGGLDLCGTPGFIAPELLQSSAAVDRRADLYSLGITLYRLLYGRMPGAAAPSGLQSDSGRGVDLAMDDRVPSWLNAIVLRLTDPSPAARFPGANAVIDAINAGSGLQFALQTGSTSRGTANGWSSNRSTRAEKPGSGWRRSIADRHRARSRMSKGTKTGTMGLPTVSARTAPGCRKSTRTRSSKIWASRPTGGGSRSTRARRTNERAERSSCRSAAERSCRCTVRVCASDGRGMDRFCS
jgi:serine/threonine protein kinase